jgi:hypothetical protein
VLLARLAPAVSPSRATDGDRVPATLSPFGLCFETAAVE